MRKELVEILRQPRLLALLVAGPFALLLLFGAGYRNDDLRMRTVFVGTGRLVLRGRRRRARGRARAVRRPEGFTDDLDAARARLADGEVDAVVVFPADPLDTVLAGEHAEIEVIHDKIDPIQQTAIEVAARLAVQEVNAQVVTAVVGSGQDALRPVDEVVAALPRPAATSRRPRRRAIRRRRPPRPRRCPPAAGELRDLVASSDLVLERLGGADDGTRRDVLARLDAIRADADGIVADGGADVAARADVAGRRSSTTWRRRSRTSRQSIRASSCDRSRRETESTVPERIEPVDFFTPSALALLLQHIAVTFAALSLVRDRELGLFELLRVGPLTSLEIVSGKTIAYLLVGMLVGVGLLEAAVHLLGVPLVGAAVWAVLAFVLVLLASLALGHDHLAGVTDRDAGGAVGDADAARRAVLQRVRALPRRHDVPRQGDLLRPARELRHPHPAGRHAARRRSGD